jgi:acyl-CoA dehydrogenase
VGRVGEENKGWEVAKYLLEFERGGTVMAGRVRAQFAKLAHLIAARCPGDSDVTARLAEIGTDLDAMEMIDLSVLSAHQAGGNPGPISSLLKLRWSELRQAVTELAVEAAGEDALRWVTERPLYETLQLPPDEEEALALMPRYLNGRAFTIMGGTTEIQTNILAKSLLNL